MATTTNFGWTTPNDTDLVKDGAAAIRTLGSSIDTSFVDLKGGTTGQVLAKATNTDLDYSWIDTKGPTNWSLLNAGGTALTGADTITVSGISGRDQIMVLVQSASSTSASAAIRLRVNTLATSIYTTYAGQITAGTSYSAGNFLGSDEPGTTDIVLATMASSAASSVDAGVTLTGCASAGVKAFNMFGAGFNSGGGEINQTLRFGQGFVNTSATITSISVRTGGSGTFDGGTVFVYTSA
jgi:hypothetical protein